MVWCADVVWWFMFRYSVCAQYTVWCVDSCMGVCWMHASYEQHLDQQPLLLLD